MQHMGSAVIFPSPWGGEGRKRNKAYKLLIPSISYREDGLYRTIESYKILIFTFNFFILSSHC